MDVAGNGRSSVEDNTGMVTYNFNVIPHDFSSSAMWKVFAKYEHIKKLVISTKRNKK